MAIALVSLRAAVVGAMLASAMPRHEVSDNRATLVLRDRTHVAVTLYIGYTEALHRALAPQQPVMEFVLAYSTMPAEVFARELRKAQTRFAAGVSMRNSDGSPLTLANWKWPTATAVQAMFREQTMQTLATPMEHAHETPMEIHADAVSASPVSTLTVALPAAFARVLVVSYKPNQVWVEPGKAAPRVVF
jgi:hypothetical protein